MASTKEHVRSLKVEKKSVKVKQLYENQWEEIDDKNIWKKAVASAVHNFILTLYF